jgi:UDP-glucose 4-epimerase
VLAGLVAANGGYHLFNAGAGAGTSVAEVIEALEQALGRPIAKAAGSRRAGDPATLCADTARLRTTLNWRPQRSKIFARIAARRCRWGFSGKAVWSAATMAWWLTVAARLRKCPDRKSADSRPAAISLR